MAGSEINQKRKKHMKSRVVVPDEAGKWFAVYFTNIKSYDIRHREENVRMLLTLGHMDLSITLTQSPPMLACTPYQMLIAHVKNPNM